MGEVSVKDIIKLTVWKEEQNRNFYIHIKKYLCWESSGKKKKP